MRIGRFIVIVLAAVGGVALFAIALVAARFLAPSRNEAVRNVPPAQGQQAASPSGGTALFSRQSGGSSFLYRKGASGAHAQRLTAAAVGIESEPAFSHDGKLVAYSFANSPEATSSVWIVGADGSGPHQVSGAGEDALHPVFSPDDSRVFYAVSARTGNNSPIVRPARHDWDVFSMPVMPAGTISGAASSRLTNRSFYALGSLDVAAVDGAKDKAKVLISTTEYPIGDVFEEFIPSVTGRNKIFQPRVAGAPSPTPVLGAARFVHNGMDILFLAATDSVGNFDYNVFSMSDVTGGEIKQLTHLKGMTTNLEVLPDGKATFVNGGTIYLLDPANLSIKALQE